MSDSGVTTPLQSLAVLTDKTSKEEDKVKAYGAYAEFMKQGEADKVVKELQNNIPGLAGAMATDVRNLNPSLAQSALQALGFSLHLTDMVRTFSKEHCMDILHALCDTITKTEDKTTVTRALWCLTMQQLPDDSIIAELTTILDCLQSISASKGTSMTIEHEVVNTVIRLLEQVPVAMDSQVLKWSKLVYPYLVHTATKIRERAMVAMEMGLTTMLGQQEHIAPGLAIDLKAFLLSQMVLLMSQGEELYIMKVWCMYVALLGKTLHHGSLINQLLPLVEKAFKNQKLEVKCAAYEAWKALIDNFALNSDIITDAKRVKLLMQVFRINNARAENVAVEKLDVWLHFAYQLGPKLSIYFDQVMMPLLHYCSGGGNIAPTIKAGTPGARTPLSGRPGFSSPSPQISIGSGGSSGSPTFSILRHKGAEILLRIMGGDIKDETLPKAQFTIEPFKHEVMTGTAFFVKHSPTLIHTFQELVCNLGAEIQDGLLLHTWYSLVAHLKNALESGSKKDSVAVLSNLLNCLRHITTTQAVTPDRILKLVTAVLCLPAKVLGSPAYNLGTSQNEIMQGCPALVLAEILFHHRILEVGTGQERFFTLLEKLITCGLSNQNAVLGFCEALMAQIESAAPNVEKPEVTWRMWSAVVHPLLDTISKTNEVNQGDALEHNFSCLNTALVFPFTHLLSQDLPQPTVKTLLKAWTDLYSTFARLAAMVTNAEANICCEEISAKIVETTTEEKLKSVSFSSAVTQCCQCICEHMDFSSFSNQHNLLGFSGSPPGFSPSKFHKRRHRPLGNLQSFVKLIAMTTTAMHENHASHSNEKKSPMAAGLQSSVVHLIQILSSLFSHLPTTTMIAATMEGLAKPMALLFNAGNTREGKVLSAATLQKLEKLWLDVTTCLQGRYNGVYDSEFLGCVSPVLEVNFLHSRRQIKNQTVILWSATFANASPLQYPTSLQSVLQKVKQKTPLRLPGWDASQVLVVEETPFSQSQADGQSQVPTPNIIGFPSPVKPAGSFLNRAVSPNVKNSPLKAFGSPRGEGAKKSLPLGELKNDDFVVITPSPAKRKRVLTPHQKEVLRERRSMPAMYNSLENSMDVSNMSMGSESQSQMSQTPTPDFDLAVPVFPFVLPTKRQKLNDGSSNTTEVSIEKEKTPQGKEDVKSEASDKSQSSSGQKDDEKKTKTRARRSVRFSVDDSTSEFSTSSQQEAPAENDKPSLSSKEENTPDSEVSQSVIKTRSKSVDQPSASSEKDVEIVGDEKPEVESAILISQDDSEKFTGDDTLADTEDSISSSQSQRRSRRVKANAAEGSPTQSQQEKSGESDTATNESDSSSQPSQKQRRSRRSSLAITEQVEAAGDSQKSKKKSSQSDSSQESQTRTRKTRSPVTQSPRRSISANIDKWLIKSPKKVEESESKRSAVNGPLAEETQQFSPGKENQFNKASHQDSICVEETPVKVEKGCVIVEMGSKEDSSRNLFSENVLQESQVFSVLSGSPPQVVSLPRKSLSPIIKLERLDPNAKEEVGDSQKSGRKGSLRRRSSMLRFSKASMDSIEGAKENAINMDDIVPSSQDSFGFELRAQKALNTEGKTSFSGIIPFRQTEEKEDDSSALCELPMDVEEVKESSIDSQSELSEQNEDAAAAADLGTESSEDIQSTLVSRAKKKKPRKILDQMKDLPVDSSQDADNVLRRTKRTPKKKKCQCGSTDHDHDHDHSDTEAATSSKSDDSVEISDSLLSSETSGETANSSDNSDASKLTRMNSTLVNESVVSSSETIFSETLSEQGLVEINNQNSSEEKSSGNAPLSVTDNCSPPEQTPDIISQSQEVKSSQIEDKRKSGRTKKNHISDSAAEADSTESAQGRKTRKSAEEGDDNSGSDRTTEKIRSKTKEKESKKDEMKADKGSSECDTSKTGNKKSQASKQQKSLDEIVNKKCNLDSESDSDDDIPLRMLSSLKNVADKEKKQAAKTTDNKESAQVNSCVDLFNDTEDNKLPEEDQKENSLDESSLDDSMENSLSSSQKKKKKASGMQSLEKLLEIDMKSPKSKKALRSNKEAKPQRNRSLSLSRRSLERRKSFDVKKKRSPRRLLSQNSQKSGSEKETVKEPEKEKVVLGTVHFVAADNDDKDKPSNDIVNCEAELKCPLEGTDSNSNHTEEEDPSEVESIVDCTSDKAETVISENVIATAGKDNSGSDKDDKKDKTSNEMSKLVNDTTDSNIIKPSKKVLSPPKKGKPFDMPETPTSATKHRSRASMILERARMVCMNKNSLSADLNKKKFTSLRPTQVGSPRTILHPKKSGILKQSQQSPTKTGMMINGPSSPSSSRTNMPGSPTFRPVHVPRVYSPSASPSAGILKKRKLTEERLMDSPSPPNKQRRVSFNDKIDVCLQSGSPSKEGSRPVNRCLELARSQLITSPLVTSTTSKVVSAQTKFLTTPSLEDGEDSLSDSDGFAVPRVMKRRDTQLTPTPSAASTQESQLNANDPIFPGLLECSASVDQILPQLTSSMWVRGLGQLVRARNISTVGDLCALSEQDVHNLPIRSPKVVSVRQALRTYAEQQGIKVDTGKQSDAEVLTTGSPSKTLPRVEDMLDKLSPIKGDLDSSIDSECEAPLALETSSVEATPSKAPVPNFGSDTTEVRCDFTNMAKTAKSVVTQADQLELVMTPALLSTLPSNKLVRIHSQLNTMMMNVVMALKDKCPVSPNSSQSSQ